jgi:hypothetical protein
MDGWKEGEANGMFLVVRVVVAVWLLVEVGIPCHQLNAISLWSFKNH